jgi:hypothetical protein
MPQPPAYNREKDFTEDFGSETDHSALNAELDKASNSINDIRSNLAVLQADDGKLNPNVITADSISEEVRAELSAGIVASVEGSVAEAAASAAAAAASETNLANAVTITNANKVAAAASEAAALVSRNSAGIDAASALASKNTVLAAEANVEALSDAVAINKTATDGNAASTLANKNSSDANAATATEQAGIATTQAGIATTQAGIATTKAADASASAAAAATFVPSLYVAKAGAETITGIKTFTVSPLAPDLAVGDNSQKVANAKMVKDSVDANNALRPVTYVRQTVSYALTNTAGYANMLSAGAGLTLNLAATAVPMKTNFAAGLNDFSSTLTADVAAVVTLPANNLSFIRQDYVSPTSATWSSTLAPVQYSGAYNQSAQSVLQFGGAAGSTTFLDDFGNTWTTTGGAKVQTNQKKFGTGALGGGGASNALNGTTDYIKTSSLNSLGGGSWALRCWFYATSLAAPGGFAGVFACSSAGVNYGAQLYVTNAGKTSSALSSNGTSNDISSGTLGTATILANTWNFLELTYDAVAGKYYVYVNGVVDQSITSAAKICSFNQTTLGAAVSAGVGIYLTTGYLDKFEFLPYCDHPNGTTYAVPTVAPNVAASGYASNFFDTSLMTMKQVSAASTVAGTNPTFTAVNRAYVAEAVTGAAAVSSVINYALNGKYDSGFTSPIPAVSTQTIKSSNLGIPAGIAEVFAECTDNDGGFVAGDLVSKITTYTSGGSFFSPLGVTTTRNTVAFSTQSGWSFSVTSKGGGSAITLQSAKWKYKITAQRPW